MVHLIRVPFKAAHIQMDGEMTIWLIPELASHMSMIEEIYVGPKRTFIYVCYASSMDNSSTYDTYICLEGAS